MEGNRIRGYDSSWTLAPAKGEDYKQQFTEEDG
jgi:hypothetical protein